MIGLFIGSFNPPTLAHLEICLLLEKRFNKIVFVPVNSKEKELIDIRDRIGMLSIYTNRYSNLVIDDIMKDYSYLNYRIIDLLKNKYKNISLIIGSDLLDKLDTFDNYQYLLENYSFIVIERDLSSLKVIKKKYPAYQNNFEIVNYKNNISSTKVRELLKNSQDTKNILDKDVSEYIKEHDLY